MAKSKTSKTKTAPAVPEKSKDEQLQEIGQAAMASIAEMVAALECDYDRLQELKDERDAYVDEYTENGGDKSSGIAEWTSKNPDEAEELTELEMAAGECESKEEAEQRIQEDPLSLQFRSGWVSNREEMEPEEFELLLGTGGPAVRIIGEINQGEPCRVRLQAQDWFTAWTDYRGQDTAVLETYCRCFCFDF